MPFYIPHFLDNVGVWTFYFLLYVLEGLVDVKATEIISLNFLLVLNLHTCKMSILLW